ncbi:MAG: hypothetical protein LBN01_03235 [Endomicrobium sp.]|nr:hypothetical protein [Endomicrobium sp.]
MRILKDISHNCSAGDSKGFKTCCLKRKILRLVKILSISRNSVHVASGRVFLVCKLARLNGLDEFEDELKYWNNEASFVTLTYIPRFLPKEVTIMKFHHR